MTANTPVLLSEISCLALDNAYLKCFRFNHDIEQKIGNRFGWKFSNKFPNLVTIFQDKCFWVLAKEEKFIPQPEQWKKCLDEIQEVLRKDLGDINYRIEWIEQRQIEPYTIAQLAVRVLKIFGNFPNKIVFPKDGDRNNNEVQVRREFNFWAETIELGGVAKPAIALSIKSEIIYSGDLEEFYQNHPFRQDPEKLLVDLKVKDIEKNSTATIVKIGGTLAEKRDELLSLATGSLSKRKLEECDDPSQPVVFVTFGKESKEYLYPLAALRPCVTPETEQLFPFKTGVQYGDLLGCTKVRYPERQNLLQSYKQEAVQVLEQFNIKLDGRSINNREFSDSFIVLDNKLSDLEVLFGNRVKGKRGELLKGLSEGGVYRRHGDYADLNRKIRLAVVKLHNSMVDSFVKQLQDKLLAYKFDSILPPENHRELALENLSGAEIRAKVEWEIDELIAQSIPADIALVFLPESDRYSDNTDEGSLYSWIKDKFLRRGIATQMIYEDTLRNNIKYILNETIPGVLGKLGNLPFVLAQDLDIADYFIGLDISRRPKKKLAGSINACASVRLYGKKGEFISYEIEDSLTEGEEIPQRTLEKLLPQFHLRNKTVLIYRDGKFRGREVECLLARAKAINAKFILVECIKDGVPRLYSVVNNQIGKPPKGAALKLSSREIILVSSDIPENKGVPRPLRLRVNELGEQVCLQKLYETTLKLTLLHYGSLKETRLPVPLYAADTIAYRRLQGIGSSLREGDRQFWL